MHANLKRGVEPDYGTPIPLFRVTMAPDAADRVAEVLASGYIGEGIEVKRFEEEFSALVGATDPPVLAVNSCTSALTLALHLCGVGPGDFVISTPMTCSASNTPIVNLGAKIVWADISPRTGLIAPESVRAILKMTHGIKAIIAVDWAGTPCDYAALKSFGIPVIQDAAHRVFALGGTRSDTEHGDYVAWSFGPIKHLTCGDGGGLLVPKEQYERAKLLRWYGLDRESKADFRCSQSISEAGYKFHMNNIAAAIGRANLPHLRRNVEHHRHNAWNIWTDAGTQYDDDGYAPENDYWFYPLLVDDREGFTKHMTARGIMVSQVHRRNDEHDCFAAFRRPLPGVDEFSRRNTALPCGSWLSTADVDRIGEAVRSWKP